LRAIASFNEETVRALLEAGADPEIRWNKGHETTPLMEAIQSNQDDVLNMLLERGVDVSGMVGSVYPIYEAINNGTTAAVQALLDHGARIESTMISSYARPAPDKVNVIWSWVMTNGDPLLQQYVREKWSPRTH